MGSNKRSLVSATRFVRRLRGSSQPFLVEASDGFLYVVKSGDNPLGPNLLCNEVFGTELYRAFGLPVPDWKPVRVTLRFAEKYRESWVYGDGGARLPTGMCYGSRFMGQAAIRLFEMLPAQYFPLIQNRGDFWKTHLLDTCAEHIDTRQAVFPEAPDGSTRAVFIDHGHMFGGPTGERSSHFRSPRYLDSRIYRDPSQKTFKALRRAVDTLNLEQLYRRIQLIPEEWMTRSALRNFDHCIQRLSRAHFVDAVVDAIAELYESPAADELKLSKIGLRKTPPVLRIELSTSAGG